MERKICALMLLTLATLAAVIGCLELFVSATQTEPATTPNASVVAAPTLASNATANELTAVSDLLDIYNGLNRQSLKAMEGANDVIGNMEATPDISANITTQVSNVTGLQNFNIDEPNTAAIYPTLKSTSQNQDETR